MRTTIRGDDIETERNERQKETKTTIKSTNYDTNSFGLLRRRTANKVQTVTTKR